MRASPPPRGPPPDERSFELEADTIRVLANPKRLRIISILADGPLSVSDLAVRLELSLQNTSQHLRLMRDRLIVRSERRGREILYALTSPAFAQACTIVRAALFAEARARPLQLEERVWAERVPFFRESEPVRPPPIPAARARSRPPEVEAR